MITAQALVLAHLLVLHENQTAIGTVTATDADGDAFTLLSLDQN